MIHEGRGEERQEGKISEGRGGVGRGKRGEANEQKVSSTSTMR